MQLNALCNRQTCARKDTSHLCRFVTKTMRVMQWTAVLMLAFCLNVAASGSSQTVSLSVKEVPLEEVLQTVEKQTGVLFLYDADKITLTRKISIEVKEVSLEKFLGRVFSDLPVAYRVEGNTVVLKAKKDSKTPTVFEEINPPITVRGRIVNEKGEAVAATIIVKGTNKGTITDNDGFFILENVADNAILVITGISIESGEIKVNGRSDVSFIARTKISGEEEITISTGYWDMTKAKSTGNISKVTSKEIEKQPVSNPIAALQGRVPGLEVTQQTGIPGGNFTVRIRGTNSIGSGNDPLYIVDGVPYNGGTMAMSESSGLLFNTGTSPLNYINPNNIQTIEVLKDAASTSIYGSRGANGVILITTKKGKAGKTAIDINTYTGVSNVAHFVDLLNTKQYVEMRKEGFSNFNEIPDLSNAVDLLLWDTSRYTHWQKELIGKTAKISDAQISLSGGDQLTQFILSGGYHKETTVFPGSDGDRRTSMLLGLNNITPNKRFRTKASINFSHSKSNFPGGDLTSTALKLSPNAPALYDSVGNLNWENQSWLNPLQYTLQQYEAKTNNFIGNINLNYSIFKWLNAKLNLGYTNTTTDAITLIPNSFYGPPVVAETYEHSSVFANTKFNNWIAEPQFEFKQNIGPGFLEALVGSSFLEQVAEGSAITGIGFIDEALMKNIGAAQDRSTVTNYYTQYRYASVFGRLNYNLLTKYIVDLTGRRDGSSRFGPGKQFANFGAAGIAWIFSNEKFVKNHLSFISFGKIRASYGSTGNDQIGDYQYLNTFTTGPQYVNYPTLNAFRLFNANFAWESNKKMEVGFEWGILKDRVNGSISFYRNRSSNQLIGYSLPPTTGFPDILSNFPATVQNKGIEISINSINVRSSRFIWNTSFNFSHPQNKLISFKDLEKSTVYATTLVVGEPLSIQRLYKYLGLDDQIGIYLVEDVNKDGIYNDLDKSVTKFVGINYSAGLQNSISFKGFFIDLMLQYVNQKQRNFLPGTPGTMVNQHVSVMQRWKKPGDVTDFQQFSAVYNQVAEAYTFFDLSDQSIVDASYLRLKNLSFSYSLPENVSNRVGFNNIRLFVQAQNLVTVTNFIGLDPESGNLTLPPLRTITAGVNLTL